MFNFEMKGFDQVQKRLDDMVVISAPVRKKVLTR